MNPTQNQGNMQNTGVNSIQQMFENFNIKAQGFKSNIEKVQSQYGEILKKKADIQKKEEALLRERAEVNNVEAKVSGELMNLTMALYSHYQEIISVTNDKVKHDQMELTKAQAEIIFRKRAEARHRNIAEAAQNLMFESAKRADDEREFRYKIAEKQKLELEKAKAEQEAAAKKIQEELRNQFGGLFQGGVQQSSSGEQQQGASNQQGNQPQRNSTPQQNQPVQQQHNQSVGQQSQQVQQQPQSNNQASQQQQQPNTQQSINKSVFPVSGNSSNTSEGRESIFGGPKPQGTVAAQVHTATPPAPPINKQPQEEEAALDKTKKYGKASDNLKTDEIEKEVINERGGDTTRGGNIYQTFDAGKKDGATPPPPPIMGESKSKMKNTFFNTEDSKSSKVPKSDIFDKTTLGTKSTLPNIKKNDIFDPKK